MGKHKPLFKHYKYAKTQQEPHDLGESSTIQHPVVRARKPADDHERPTEETYQPDEIEEDYDPIDDMLKANGWSRDRLMSRAQLQAQQNVGGGPAPHRGYQMSGSGDGDDEQDESGDLGESNDIDDDDDDHEEGHDDDNDHEDVMTPQDKAEEARDEARSTAKATAPKQADLGNEGELGEDDDHPDLGESGGVSVPALHPDQADQDAAGDEDAAGDAEKNLEAADTP